ncbi:MAG: 4-phosphoerythronate dehydrogenase [Lysobacterales bacterium]
MNFLIDRNLKAARNAFGRHGTVHVMDGRQIRRQHLHDIEAMIIRTTTRVDSDLLEGTPVAFVGSASIGTDHLDVPWLEKNGIHWANAPGCNADAAAQYTLASIWLACERLGKHPRGMTAGVIGRGNVGSRVQRLLATIGMEVVANDPPLQERGAEGLVRLEDALSCDVVTLHTPLTREGPWPTHRMIGPRRLTLMKQSGLLVNAGRGNVIDGAALLESLSRKRVHAALDVWPGEPRFSGALIESTVVATPHVAGYSDEGRFNGTAAVYRAFCDWQRIEAEPIPFPGTEPDVLTVESGDAAIARALDAACFVKRHDDAMRRLVSLGVDERAAAFDRLRKDYPPRRDFHAWRLRCDDRATRRTLGSLGFRLEDR